VRTDQEVWPFANYRAAQSILPHVEVDTEVYDGELEVGCLNLALEEWEVIYNTCRPHQALDWSTPAEYLIEHHPEVVSVPKLSHM